MKKELQPIILFIAALIVFGTLSLFGVFYNIGKAIYGCCQLKFWKGIIYLLMYLLKMVYQLWNVVKYFLNKSAVAIDLFGNVAGGEFVEDFVTAKEDTWYGRGDRTVSAATGELEFDGNLNKKGIWFTELLSKALGKNHSIDAYKKELKNQ